MRCWHCAAPSITGPSIGYLHAIDSDFERRKNHRMLLVTTTLALDYWLGGGLQPRQFHVSQIAMLIMLGVMVFHLYLRLMTIAEAHWWNRYAALAAASPARRSRPASDHWRDAACAGRNRHRA